MVVGVGGVHFVSSFSSLQFSSVYGVWWLEEMCLWMVRTTLRALSLVQTSTQVHVNRHTVTSSVNIIKQLQLLLLLLFRATYIF